MQRAVTTLSKRYQAVGLLSLVVAIILMGISYTMPSVRATSAATSTSATVTVSASCALTGTVNTEHTATINNGQSRNSIGSTTLTATCNDPSGFAIYAVGYGQNTVGNNKLHSRSLSSDYDIPTGTASTGNTSQWSMQLSQTGTLSPSILNNYDSAHGVPDRYEKVAQYGSSVGVTAGATVNTTYNAYISPSQPAGTYTGKVKYVLMHPSGSAPSDNLTMQNVALWKDTMLDGETYKVVDARDNKEYYVAKLDDGNIWMTQNLDLCIGCTGTTPLTSENTDLNVAGSGIYTDGYDVDGNNVISWTPSGTTMTGTPATITYPESGISGTVSGWTNDGVTPYMAEGGTEYVSQGVRFADIDACIAAYSEEICDHNHVGNYYNYTASIASNASDSISGRYATAENSICPAGWRLPKGPDGTRGSEFEVMLKAAGIANPNNTDNGSGSEMDVGYIGGSLSGTDMEKSPYYFARSGYVDGTTLYNFTSFGDYWSGSAVSSSYAFLLHYRSSGLYPAGQSYRSYGWGLRCIAR